MNSDELMGVVEQSSLAEHHDFFHQMARPSVDIVRMQKQQDLGCSKLGGEPHLPPGSQWPEHPQAYYRFIGQINFADVDAPGTDLPRDGLLSLFYAEDEGEGTAFWQDDGYIFAMYTPQGVPLEVLSPPSLAHFSKKSVSIGFIPGVDIPFDNEQVESWPFGDPYGDESTQCDDYAQLRESLHQSEDYLLGYPSHCSLAYNPTPGPEFISLLTLNSDDKMQWCWHDGDKLMIFIERAKLKQCDFSALKADAG